MCVGIVPLSQLRYARGHYEHLRVLFYPFLCVDLRCSFAGSLVSVGQSIKVSR